MLIRLVFFATLFSISSPQSPVCFQLSSLRVTSRIKSFGNTVKPPLDIFNDGKIFLLQPCPNPRISCEPLQIQEKDLNCKIKCSNQDVVQCKLKISVLDLLKSSSRPSTPKKSTVQSSAESTSRQSATSQSVSKPVARQSTSRGTTSKSSATLGSVQSASHEPSSCSKTQTMMDTVRSESRGPSSSSKSCSRLNSDQSTSHGSGYCPKSSAMRNSVQSTSRAPTSSSKTAWPLGDRQSKSRGTTSRSTSLLNGVQSTSGQTLSSLKSLSLFDTPVQSSRPTTSSKTLSMIDDEPSTSRHHQPTLSKSGKQRITVTRECTSLSPIQQGCLVKQTSKADYEVQCKEAAVWMLLCPCKPPTSQPMNSTYSRSLDGSSSSQDCCYACVSVQPLAFDIGGTIELTAEPVDAGCNKPTMNRHAWIHS